MSHGVIMAALFFLFFLRVLGQVIVVLFNPDWLPSMAHWYSGLIPYPYLLSIQIMMLIIMPVMCFQVWLGHGWFASLSSVTGQSIQWFSYLYGGGMVIRYIVTMYYFPERRWAGEGTIPTVSHWVLAGYLWTYGQFLLIS